MLSFSDLYSTVWNLKSFHFAKRQKAIGKGQFAPYLFPFTFFFGLASVFNRYDSVKSSVVIAALVVLIFTNMLFSGCSEETTEPFFETSTVADIDGNIYSTIKIGNQWWMAENLKVTKFRNGKPILNLQATDAWKAASESPVYCIYGDNTPNNSDMVGLLYNWYAVYDTSNLAPDGWHVSTDEEWKELEIYLGMSRADADKINWRGTNEGEKLKIEELQGWIRHGTGWPTNESGFTALAGSCRLFNGLWGEPGLFHTGFWWTSSQHSGGKAWFRYLDYKNPNVFRNLESKNYGFSIRCVKD